VRLLSYALDYSVWGIKPFGYHFGNILLHALNAFLIYLLLLRLFAAPKPALLAAFFFLVHPMQVESVAWISGRKEVLCGFFLLLSALCFHEHLTRDLVPREQVRKTTALIPYLLSLIFFILACLSKASAIVLPLLLVAIWLFAARPAERPRSESLQAFARWVAPFFVLAALVFALNLYVAWSHDVVKPYHGGGPMTTFLTMAYVLKNYILGLAFPANLSAKYFVPLVPSPFTGQFVSAACLILAVLLFILASRSPMAALGASWFVIALLPFLNIIPISTMRADRYVYIPSAGAALVLAAAFSAVRGAKTRWTLAVLALLFLSVLSWERTHVWLNSRALWMDTVAKSPLSPMSQANLGEVYQAAGQTARAEAQFERTLAYDPAYSPALTNLSIIWREGGRKADAFSVAERAVKADPHNPDAWINLGVLQAEKGDLETAYLTFGEAANLNPALAEAYSNMAGVRLVQKRPGDAMRLYYKAISVQPTFTDAHLRLGILLLQARRPQEALASFQQVCRLNPDSAEGFYYLALTYLVLSQPDLAAKAASQALRLGMPEAQGVLNKIRNSKSENRNKFK
jgi:tetratricopeptide (TPR) repeat protein